MLITESQMNIGKNLTAFDILDNMEFLTEADSVYAPAMVPIVENTRLQSNMINLEDLTSFAESNGINDLGYALQMVCEASDISPNTVSFVVDKVSLIESDEIANITSSLLNENVNVVVKPLNYNDNVVSLYESVFNICLENRDYSGIENLFMSLAEADAATVQQNMLRNVIRQKKSGGKGNPSDTRSEQEIRDSFYKSGQLDREQLKKDFNYYYGDGTYEKTMHGVKHNWSGKKKASLPVSWGSDDGSSTLNATRQKSENSKDYSATAKKDSRSFDNDGSYSGRELPSGNGMPSLNPWDYEEDKPKSGSNTSSTSTSQPTSQPKSTDKKTEEKLKDIANKSDSEWKSKPRMYISKVLAWLHDKAKTFNDKLKSDGKNAPWYNKVLGYITRAIQKLTKFLHNKVAEKGKEIGDSSYSSFYKAK